MTEKKKRIREKPGQVFRVPLSNGMYGYGQLIDPDSVFFDYKDNGENTDLSFVLTQPIIFCVTVDSYAIKDQLWKVIDVLPMNSEFKKLNSNGFNYDLLKNIYYIWEKGVSPTPTSPKDIKDLEMITSWKPLSVEQRLLDYFEGRPNYSYEWMHNLHNPNFPKTRKEFYAQYEYTMKEDEDGSE